MNQAIPRYYAGIGSRTTPATTLADMRRIAASLATQDWHLSSGGAHGADSAFASAAPPSRRRIYLPRPGHNGHTAGRDGCLVIPPEHLAACEETARQHHPAWHRCSAFAHLLHARNTAIILGHDLRVPVRAVICWTPGGKITGGTATGIRIALAAGIPVINLATVPADIVISRMKRIAGTITQQA